MTAPLLTTRDALADGLLDALCASPIWDGRHIGELEVAICDGIADRLLSSGVVRDPATLADDEELIPRVTAQYGAERTRITRTVLRALAVALTDQEVSP